MLKPTKIYVKEMLSLINKNIINGCANITGGGLQDNLSRVIPKGLCANIELNKIKTQPIFNWLKSQRVNEKEMLNTFNCGVGFCIIIESKNLKIVEKIFKKNYKPYIIGKISIDNKKYKSNGKVNWKK